MNNSILVVDDEQAFLDSIRRGLISSGFKNLRFETDPRMAADLFVQGNEFDVALIDLRMPLMDGIELIELIKNTSPSTECIMITAVDEARIAVTCLRKGAYDYLVKPISREDLVLAINRALERKRLLDIVDLNKREDVDKMEHPEAFKALVTRSVRVLRILKEASLHAVSDVPVLITGESGTGKELLAQAIHAASPRARNAFTAVNMASLASTLFDAEFFGHTKGAFTGAERDRQGYLEHANHGTIFLDEIGHLPLELQGKLLRVLQEREYLKLGTSKTQKADVRFITATNADLDRLLAKGAFRKDLYYRLRGAWLHLPPLRERKEDIPLLNDRFLKEFCGNAKSRKIDEQALSLLMAYGYPGNIRELRSILQAAVNLAQGKTITAHCLPEGLAKRKPVAGAESQVGTETIVSLPEVEKAHILRVYNATERNKARTAKLLGIGLNTLRRKLESYGEE